VNSTLSAVGATAPELDAMTAEEIRLVGLKYAIDWLQRSGYVLTHGAAPAAGPPEIEVDHPSARILVRVSISMAPALPAELKRDEVDGLKSRAASLGRRPYAARVLMDSAGHLLGDVHWQRLS
jgi:hypothetical protein